MTNNVEAAEMLEANIESLRGNLKELNTVLDTLTLRGDEDLTDLRKNIQTMKDIIAQNEATAKYIRDTAN